MNTEAPEISSTQNEPVSDEARVALMRQLAYQEFAARKRARVTRPHRENKKATNRRRNQIARQSRKGNC